jgi:hypothetical protein
MSVVMAKEAVYVQTWIRAQVWSANNHDGRNERVISPTRPKRPLIQYRKRRMDMLEIDINATESVSISERTSHT